MLAAYGYATVGVCYEVFISILAAGTTLGLSVVLGRRTMVSWIVVIVVFGVLGLEMRALTWWFERELRRKQKGVGMQI